jgi:hypothetical protein
MRCAVCLTAAARCGPIAGDAKDSVEMDQLERKKMIKTMRMIVGVAAAISICLSIATPADAVWSRNLRGEGPTITVGVGRVAVGSNTCTSGIMTETIREVVLQPARLDGNHLEEVLTNLRGCINSRSQNVNIRSDTVQLEQPPRPPGNAFSPLEQSKFEFTQLKSAKAEIEVKGSEKCNVEFPAEGNGDLETNTGQTKDGETEIVMADEHLVEKGEETAACKEAGENGTKKEGKFTTTEQLKGVKIVAPGGGFSAASYPIKISAGNTANQVFQFSKGAEMVCEKAHFIGGEPPIQETNELKLYGEYGACETKDGLFTGKATVSMGECVYDFELEKNEKIGTASVECEKGNSIDIKTGIMTCEVKIGPEKNEVLKEVEFANIEGKPKKIEIIPHISGLEVEATECGSFGIEKGNSGKYTGTIKAEAENETKGEGVGLEVN